MIPVPRGYEASRLLRLRLEEEEEQQQQALEVERRLSEMSLMQKSVLNQPYFSYQMKELKVPEGHCSLAY